MYMPGHGWNSEGTSESPNLGAGNRLPVFQKSSMCSYPCLPLPTLMSSREEDNAHRDASGEQENDVFIRFVSLLK